MIFSGIMISTRYVEILQAWLVPFIQGTYPEGHRFQQDNDPKHCSRYTQSKLEELNINWWKTPPESPDMNPIENVWGSMKTFLRIVHTYKYRLTHGFRRYTGNIPKLLINTARGQSPRAVLISTEGISLYTF